MIKSHTCPVADGTNELPIRALFLKCYNPATQGVDASEAIFQWKQDNYIRVTDSDYVLMSKLGVGEAFKLFVQILVETFGEEHITAPPKHKTGFKGQSQMFYARKSPRRMKPRCFAFNRRENQLNYLGVAL